MGRVLDGLDRWHDDTWPNRDRALALARALGEMVVLASADEEDVEGLQDACADELLHGRDTALRSMAAASRGNGQSSEATVLSWHSSGDARRVG